VSDRPGIVYIAENPAWPGWVKVGRAETHREGRGAALRQRLHQFNTGDPCRAYDFHADFFASCCYTAEQFAHTLLEIGFQRGGGEWFRCSRDIAHELVGRVCAIACLRPTVRGRHFNVVLEEVRVQMAGLDETHKIMRQMIAEDAAPKPARQIEVTETARAAHAVIDALLSQMAMPDENTEAAARAVQRRLDILGGLA